MAPVAMIVNGKEVSAHVEVMGLHKSPKELNPTIQLKNTKYQRAKNTISKVHGIDISLDEDAISSPDGNDLYIGENATCLAMCLSRTDKTPHDLHPTNQILHYSNAGEKRISKLLVRCVGDEQLIVSSVMIEDNASGQQWKHPVNQVFLSPGSSLRSLSLKPENYSLMEHLRDVVNGYWKLDFYKKMNRQGYRPTIRSVLRHVVNDVETTFGGERIRLEHIGRSALGSMLIIQIDPERAGREKIDQLTKQFCRQANRLVGLRERRVVNEDGKEQVVYLAQVIGNSGEDVDAEIAQANIESNAELCQLLHSRGFDYDVVSQGNVVGRRTESYLTGQCRFGSTFASNVHLQEGERMMIGKNFLNRQQSFAVQCQSDGKEAGTLSRKLNAVPLSKIVKRRLGADDSLSKFEYGTIIGTVAIGVGLTLLFKRGHNLSPSGLVGFSNVGNYHLYSNKVLYKRGPGSLVNFIKKRL